MKGNKTTGPGKRLISIKEAGEYLSRSTWTVAEMVRTGKLPYVRDGRRKLLDIEDINEWIRRNKVVEDDTGTLSYLKEST
ncbi:MAG: helix-turn-helix domain-containing protein [Alphaproteobacteria bacterium]|uniref:Helix-turn-helix domain-containing protein n=1 Tax=Candidatus Nitrobium versatile TaxID=2884831 RepID=A0A953JAK5_9BACT|nr:helix-turn-helix domain-containing protein [Candidatus Nitrobium versatile]